jgi:hypothetical protein
MYSSPVTARFAANRYEFGRIDQHGYALVVMPRA